jgi:crotonobetainyl-CoA:carnitine CoA-transferase CaiB-like acyl-CoA transferase
MTEGALALLIAELGNLDCGVKPTRGAETLNGGLACYGVYRCKDDRFLSVGALEPKFWLAFNQAIGRTGTLAEIADPRLQDRVREEIAAIVAQKTRDEWAPILAAHDCCCEPVLELDELPAHPQHVARDVFFTIDGGAVGPVMQIRTPVGAPARPTPPPTLGQQSREVLGEYGFSADEIAAVLAAG